LTNADAIGIKFHRFSTNIEVAMEKIGYFLIGSVALLWIIGMVAGLIVAFPYGIIGLVVLAGFGLLFAKVLKERLASKEDDYYSKNIQQ